VVHGKKDRLSPESHEWTLEAQTNRDPTYVAFLKHKARIDAAMETLRCEFDLYLERTFPGLFGGDGRGDGLKLTRHKCFRAELYERLTRDERSNTKISTPTFADYNPSGPDVVGYRFRDWFDRGGGDGWKKLSMAWTSARRFRAMHELMKRVGDIASSLENRHSKETNAAHLRICEPSLALVCTCASVGGLMRANPDEVDVIQRLAQRCTTLIVDEAGTCADACLVPCLPHTARGGTFQRLLLVGDSRQLPPFTRLRENAAAVSLLERIDKTVGSAMLTAQYRMFDDLNTLISNMYYQGRLHTAKADSAGELKVHLVKGIAEKEPNGHSLCNQLEMECALTIASQLCESGAYPPSVVILSFYKAQMRLLRDKLDNSVYEGINVLSVDSAQGQEWEHVILSCVVDGGRRSFLQDARRMNVALSRARKTLDIVCHTSLPYHLPVIASATGATSMEENAYPVGPAKGRFRKRGSGRGR